MGKFFKTLLSLAVLLASIAWGSAAVFFGDSSSGLLQICLSAAFVTLGATALVAFFVRPWRKPLLTVYSIAFIAVLVWWFAIAPSNDRQWQADVEKLAYATFQGDQVTVHNIRNFDYRSEFDYLPAYYDKTFDLNKLQGVDLLSIYWMGPAIAHTILSFDFGGNDHLAVSIEARKERSEGYSTIKGFFRQFELIYIVADERDVIRLRTNYRHNPPEQVYLYRLLGPEENVKPLFMEYMRKINELNDHPEFYNTLLDNCTTAIWMRTLVNAGHLPFSWKILLSGYVPDYLYEAKRLDTTVSFSELQKQGHINARAQAAEQDPGFSARIRSTAQ